ncbi:MAG: hypothetical protein QG665_400 [Patescibacteria group bacterium]|nr:hypothetical protein [Patescibacteria group bacterium]
MSTKKYSSQELQSKLHVLPEPLQDAILSIDTSEVIKVIGQKHKLHIDQVGKLGEEVLYAMLGLTKPISFIDELEKGLNVSTEVAEQITADLNAKIFIPVVESLKNRDGEDVDYLDQVIQETPATTATPKNNDIPTDIAKNTNNPDFFEKKMSHLFTSTADLRAERAEVEDYTPPTTNTQEDKTPLTASIPLEKKRPEGLDPYREMPL